MSTIGINYTRLMRAMVEAAIKRGDPSILISTDQAAAVLAQYDRMEAIVLQRRPPRRPKRQKEPA